MAAPALTHGHEVALARPAGDPGPRRSLVLAGGGMRVAYQAGVLKALAEAGLGFDHADGTSGGTMNLAMLLSGLTPSEMCERWSSLRVRDFVSFMPPREYLRADGPLALGDADGIVQHVFPHLGIDIARINSGLGMQGTFNVCNFTTKTNRAVPHDELELGLLVAGISLPAFMPPVTVDGADYVDSVWIKDANLLEAVRRGAEEIWLVWCIGNAPRYKRGAFNQYVHMIELSANGALFAELDHIAELNRGIEAGAARPGRRPIRFKVIKPEYPLPLDPSYYLGQIDGATLVAQGYADAWRRLDRRDADDPLGDEATRMRSPESVIAWREGVSGVVEVSASERPAPRGRIARAAASDGAAASEKAAAPDWVAARERPPARGPQLELDLSVFVNDLSAFIADPDHRAPLVGYISLDGKTRAPFRDGTFRCVRSADTRERRLIHEALFRADGSDRFHHIGIERRIGGSARSLHRDLADLHVQIRAGDSPGAPLLVRGILRNGASGPRALCCGIRAIEPDSPAAGARACQRFGRFVFGELYDAYARPWWKFW